VLPWAVAARLPHLLVRWGRGSRPAPRGLRGILL